MTTPTAPEPAQVAGTIFDEASAELARTYATALLDATGSEAGAALDELEEIVADVLGAQRLQRLGDLRVDTGHVEGGQLDDADPHAVVGRDDVGDDRRRRGDLLALDSERQHAAAASF